ncbi:MAG: hypothetical protein OM95_03335 [Bdellovibrio sp. ArHS]|uniref:hypothetical protein n=1 Tax=Bdellovibrio sp. ArHS TaxID=1569284 RepID=UPI000582873E|nr:hypothetical protein [Bdellovibrio sp. ArHS]KHD89414.1 MAG: hypothetical protein OM95_03335 [Bdellovibrio sp. ArHS]
MKSALLTFFILFSSCLAFAGRAVSFEETQQLQNSALIDRLNLILAQRVSLLKNCSAFDFHAKAVPLTGYLSRTSLESPEILSQQRKIIYELIGGIKNSLSVEQKCRGTAQIQSIRQPFFFSENTENVRNPLNRLWWKSLEPSCYRVRLKGELSNVDSNACFAGDRLVLKQFEKLQKPLTPTSLDYSYALLAKLSRTVIGGELKLEEAFLEEFQQDNPALLLSALTVMGSSGPSGLTGWLQGIEDRLLVQDLNSPKSKEQIFAEFSDLQTAKYNYMVFRSLVDKNQIKITLYGYSVNDWNRHNIMAAFLGCSQKASFGAKTASLVYLTGMAYEAKDFVSHLKEGVGFLRSRQNFKEDTNRYKLAGAFGYSICK